MLDCKPKWRRPRRSFAEPRRLENAQAVRPWRRPTARSASRRPTARCCSAATRPENDTYTLTFEADVDGITAVRLEVLADPSLPKQGPGRHDNGNCI